jgi:hypothetical protein
VTHLLDPKQIPGPTAVSDVTCDAEMRRSVSHAPTKPKANMGIEPSGSPRSNRVPYSCSPERRRGGKVLALGIDSKRPVDFHAAEGHIVGSDGYRCGGSGGRPGDHATPEAAVDDEVGACDGERSEHGLLGAVGRLPSGVCAVIEGCRFLVSGGDDAPRDQGDGKRQMRPLSQLGVAHRRPRSLCITGVEFLRHPRQSLVGQPCPCP